MMDRAYKFINQLFKVCSSLKFDSENLDTFKVIMQGKLIAVVYTLRTY